MAEKIEVGVVVKGAGKAASDISKVGQASKNLGGNLKGNSQIVNQLTGSLDKMTGGAFSGFKNAAMGLKTFITGLKTTKTAIIATGIGALVVAFGLLVTYWDDIKVLVNGVSKEQQDLLKYAEGTRDAAQAQLDITNQSEASLKLAGKSEREILNLKIQQTNEIILATEAILIQQKELKRTQVEAARKNQEITAGIIAFMQLPITLLLSSVDALTLGLSKLGLIEEATNFVEDAAMFTASFLFDPETVEEEGDATISALEDTLRTMKNSRDGFINTKKAQDAAADKAEKDAADKAKEDTATSEQEAIDTQKAIDDAKIAAQIRLEDELYALSLSDKEREELALQQKYDERAAIAEGNEALEKDAKQQYYDDLEALQNKYDKGGEDSDKKRIEREKAVAKAVRAARLGVVSAGFDALKSMAKTEEGQKKLAIAQILVNQGIAMSNAVVAGLSAAAKMPQPAGLFAAPGFVATALGIALSSFASIKGVMNQAGAATAGLDTTMPSLSGGGGGGGDTSGSGNQLALTPDMAGSFLGNSAIPPVQAYIVQNDIADAGALQTELQTQASL
tara:strand:+ start:3622 stop:5316 length:1695 start_codon:yes stop_codon:yes gene_type:complete